jgi:hypothetical protein
LDYTVGKIASNENSSFIPGLTSTSMASSALSLDWKLDPATSFLMFWMTPDELLSRILSFNGGVVGLRFSVFSTENFKISLFLTDIEQVINR